MFLINSDVLLVSYPNDLLYIKSSGFVEISATGAKFKLIPISLSSFAFSFSVCSKS